MTMAMMASWCQDSARHSKEEDEDGCDDDDDDDDDGDGGGGDKEFDREHEE